MDLHGRAAGVRENIGDALSFESLDEDIGALSGFVGGKSGGRNVRAGEDGGVDGSGRGGGGGGGGFGGRVGERTADAKRAAESGIVRKRGKREIESGEGFGRIER